MLWRDIPESPRVRARLEEISEPYARMVEAAATARRAKDAYDLRHRPRRNAALILLHRHRGWKKPSCYKPSGIERGSFDSAINRAPATLAAPIGTVNWAAVGDLSVEEETFLDLEQEPDKEIFHFAKVAHRAYRDNESAWKTAVLIRDELIRQLTSGPNALKNADVATACQMQTSAVAQVREGERNPHRTKPSRKRQAA